jgi:hypothetical protein
MPLTIEPRRTRFSVTFGLLHASWSASHLLVIFFQKNFCTPSGCLTGLVRLQSK